MAGTEIVASRLEPNGDRVALPVLRELDRFAYHVVLDGLFQFSYNGEAFDARYRSGQGGAFSEPHDYLQWSPLSPILESEDAVRHRYVFRIPPERKLEGASVGVRVDVDRFVNEFLIPPSEVHAALTGGLSIQLLQTPIALPIPWPLIAGGALPAAILAGGVGWVIRRRRVFQGLSPEAQIRLSRIDQSYRAARAALRAAPGSASPLTGRLAAVRDDAFTLAGQIRHLRSTRALADPIRLEAEIDQLQRRLAACPDEHARHEGERALEEKRRSRAHLEAIDRAEARCTLRLLKIEALLESTCLTLRNETAPAPDAAAEEALRRELDAEASAVAEVMGEAAACEAGMTILDPHARSGSSHGDLNDQGASIPNTSESPKLP